MQCNQIVAVHISMGNSQPASQTLAIVLQINNREREKENRNYKSQTHTTGNFFDEIKQKPSNFKRNLLGKECFDVFFLIFFFLIFLVTWSVV